MSLRITIDVFSGRPNPVIEVSGRQEKEILEHLKPEGVISKREVASLTRPHLGYRGIIIEQIGVRTRKLPQAFRVVGGAIISEIANRAADEELEDFLVGRRGPLGRVKMETGFRTFLGKVGKQARHRQVRPVEPVSGEIGAAVGEPAVEPIQLCFEPGSALCCGARPDIVHPHQDAPCHRPHHGAPPFLLARPILISIDHKNWYVDLAVALSRLIPFIGMAEQV